MAYSDCVDRLRGQTLDGKNPLCRCYCEPKPGYFVVKYPKDQPRILCEPRCPPLEPKPGCFWAPRPKNFTIKNYPCKYCPPKCCTRPCCLHIKPKECSCVYDDPCCAACVDHPPGMGPSNRYPPPVWCGPMGPRPCRPYQ